MLHIAAPLLALQAIAAAGAGNLLNPLAGPICTAHGVGLTPSAPHHHGACPACPYCTAVQAVVTPTPVTAPLPRTIWLARVPSRATGAWHGARPVHATARSPPAVALLI